MSVSAFHARTIGKKEIRILKTCFRINEIFNRVFTRIYIYFTLVHTLYFIESHTHTYNMLVFVQ